MSQHRQLRDIFLDSSMVGRQQLNGRLVTAQWPTPSTIQWVICRQTRGLSMCSDYVAIDIHVFVSWLVCTRLVRDLSLTADCHLHSSVPFIETALSLSPVNLPTSVLPSTLSRPTKTSAGDHFDPSRCLWLVENTNLDEWLCPPPHRIRENNISFRLSISAAVAVLWSRPLIWLDGARRVV